MEDYEKFEQLLQRCSYKELNAEDQQLVHQFVSNEEEYESLRLADQDLYSFFHKKIEFSPHPKTWSSIKDALTGPPLPRYYWISKPMPVYATLLLLLTVGSLCWIGGSNYASIDQASVTQPIPQADTVFITSKPDTVVRERVVYIEHHAQAAAVLQVSSKSIPDHPVAKGVNMKEKEELENLLVSGSR